MNFTSLLSEYNDSFEVEKLAIKDLKIRKDRRALRNIKRAQEDSKLTCVPIESTKKYQDSNVTGTFEPIIGS